MIHIEKNQKISENENIKVFSKTGDYNDTDQIEFCSVDNTEISLGAFQAQYVKYGAIVYRFNDPRELGAEILKIDPESTHSAASYVRMNNELLRQMNAGSLEPESLNNALEEEQQVMQEKIDETKDTTEEVVEEVKEKVEEKINTPSLETVSSTSTPPVISEITSTSTPVTNEISTTTPSVVAPTVEVTSTTTPAFVEENVSTTTPAVDIEEILPTPSPEPEEAGSPATTTDEIVAYAKKVVKRKIKDTLKL